MRKWFGIGPNDFSDSSPRTGKQLLDHWNHIKTAFAPVYAKFILIKSGEHATDDRGFDDYNITAYQDKKYNSATFQKVIKVAFLLTSTVRNFRSF